MRSFSIILDRNSCTCLFVSLVTPRSNRYGFRGLLLVGVFGVVMIALMGRFIEGLRLVWIVLVEFFHGFGLAAIHHPTILNMCTLTSKYFLIFIVMLFGFALIDCRLFT